MTHNSLLHLCAAAGGEERSQLVGGDVTAVDLDRLDPGAQYEVQVMALVQNREGTPVSVRITTREFCLKNLVSTAFYPDMQLEWKKNTFLVCDGAVSIKG